jgi:hypothetical protein
MSAPLLFKALRAPLPPEQKLVLLVLSDFADGDGLAWPTLARLAEMTGYSTQDVQAALRALLAADVVSIIPHGKPSVGQPNQYLINGSAIDRLSDRRAQA